MLLSEDGTAVTYAYNASGMRTCKDVGGTKTYYYYDNNNNLIGLVKGSTTMFFYYDSSNSPVSVSCNGEMYYYIKNLQGDIVKIIDQSGVSWVTYSYDALGNVTEISGEPNLRALNPLRYRGYVYDDETGLYYLQTRYYDPETGRFLNADVYCDTQTGTTLSTNMFAYCENNAINNLDESGNSSKSKNKISNSYTGTTKKGFSITSKIYINNKYYNIYSTLTKGGILKFYFNRNPNYPILFDMGRTRIVAEALFKAVKNINKKYKKKYLKGRTIPGINSEISWHYRAYYLGLLSSHANPADLGSIYSNNSGYDSNAWLFEPKIDWGDEKL